MLGPTLLAVMAAGTAESSLAFDSRRSPGPGIAAPMTGTRLLVLISNELRMRSLLIVFEGRMYCWKK